MKNTCKQKEEQQQQQYGLIKAYLGYQGYSIFKDTLSVDQQHAIRKELMVHAHIPKSPIQPAPFPVYRESLLKLYVPRYFGMERYGSNIENKSRLISQINDNMSSNDTNINVLIVSIILVIIKRD
jgi:hypothetical protein